MKRISRGLRMGREPFGSAGLIVAIIALVLGSVGGAYAAKHYVITSTSQIKPSVLKKLKGAVGPQGPQGSPGANGSAGAAGKDGTNGTNGTNGKDGTSTTTTEFSGVKGSCEEGGVEVHSASPDTLVCNGKTGFTETLPSDKTETGVWAMGNIAEDTPYPGAGNPVNIPLSFAIPLAAELDESHVHVIQENGKEINQSFEEIDSSNCHGTVAAPAADAGHLCVYIGEITNGLAYFNGLKNPATGELGASTAGMVFQVFAKANGMSGRGTWAVTAP